MEQWEPMQQGLLKNSEEREALLARTDHWLHVSWPCHQWGVLISIQSDQLVRIQITKACITLSNIPCWETAREELLKLHNCAQEMSWHYRLHQKRPGFMLHSLIPQLYGLSKYRQALEETVPKCGVTGNQWNILVCTKLLNPHPQLATLQAASNCLEILMPTVVAIIPL